MTLGTLVFWLVVLAALLTTAIHFLAKSKNWKHNAFYGFLQNFTGVLLLVSGAVKAVDPLGTAFKMEQYFGEFEATASGTWFAFAAPIFPWMANFAIGFSVFMIVFELALGVMLLLGYRPKLTAWLFFLMTAFFTVLTGYSYLTGYVPSGVNFFEFSKWSIFLKTNMKVTDCGCFGDFLKIEPKLSFIKDIVLLVPAVLFLVGSAKLNQWFSAKVREFAVAIATAASLLFCFQNYLWNDPMVDFRPFKVGVNIREQKVAEMQALAEVQITGYRMINTKTGKVVEFSASQYDTEIGKFPEQEGWDRNIMEQIKTEPAVPTSKISDFMVEGEMVSNEPIFVVEYAPNETLEMTAADTIGAADQGWKILQTKTNAEPTHGDITDALLTNPNYSFMVVTYSTKKTNRQAYSTKVAALQAAAAQEGLPFYAVTPILSPDDVAKFRKDANVNYPVYFADDILLKTIIRSNPGVVLLKNGEIIQKWHHRHLPSFDVIKAQYFK